MANTENQLVIVGKVNPRRRKFVLVGNIVTILIIGIIGVTFLIRYFVTRQNKVSNNPLDSSETETSVTDSIPTTVSTTIPGTIYISYIRTNQNDIQSNESFTLDSRLIYNSEDEIKYDGYITIINLTLYQPFIPISTTDSRIHFLTILNNNILSHITVTPSFVLIFHTFEIAPWELIVKPGSFLCIGIDSGQLLSIENSNIYANKISITQTGKAYSSTNFYSPYENIQPKWNGEQMGIALSFTIVHNPIWNGTAPPRTTTTTVDPYQYTSYGSLDDVLNIGIQLNSFAYFNWADKCKQRGYIINIRIQFCTPFQKEYTEDGFLWFFVTHPNGDLLSKYAVIPQNLSLVQVFEIPRGALLLSSEYYLSVGTLSNNYKSNNTICLREAGYAYSFHINNTENNPNNPHNPQWIGQEYGIALSYHTTNEGTEIFPPEGVDIG